MFDIGCTHRDHGVIYVKMKLTNSHLMVLINKGGFIVLAFIYIRGQNRKVLLNY